MLTDNEKKVLRILMVDFNRDHSINEIAKNCSLTPNGAFKILKKFEKEGILKIKEIANIKSYKIDFEDEKTTNILELTLIPELEGRIKYRFEDLKPLKRVTKACAVFGSYVTSKKEPDDIDILFILNKQDYKEFSDALNKIKDIIPAKIHDVIQTKEDIISNLIKEDEIVTEALKKGIVLWGQDIIVKLIKNVSQRET